MESPFGGFHLRVPGDRESPNPEPRTLNPEPRTLNP